MASKWSLAILDIKSPLSLKKSKIPFDLPLVFRHPCLMNSSVSQRQMVYMTWSAAWGISGLGINKDSIIKRLDSLYDYALKGPPGTPSVEELADEYRRGENGDIEKAVDSLIRCQTTKTFAASFATGLAGVVGLPAGLVAPLCIQLRMISAIAHLYGWDPSSDQVKTFVYLALLGNKVKEVLQGVGVEIGKKLTMKLISSIDREVLTSINQAVGFRLVTKFGQTGVVNLGKAVPLVGGVISGGLDGYGCHRVGRAAKLLFYRPRRWQGWFRRCLDWVGRAAKQLFYRRC